MNWKRITVVYDNGLEEEVLKVLEEEKIENYQIFPRVKVSWEKQKKHMDSHTWPGTDSVLALILEEEQTLRLFEKYKKLKSEMDYYVTFKVIVQPVDMFLP